MIVIRKMQANARSEIQIQGAIIMSVKKGPSGRRPNKGKDEASGSTPTAAERRSAETELSALIDNVVPDQTRLMGALRKSLRKRLPTAHEIVYEYGNQGAVVISYSPSEHGYEGVLALRADADGVKLYFNRGKELPDPAKLLQGASQTRWIKMETTSTIARPEIASLIDQAIAQNVVRFAREGRGSVVIRSTSAKKGKRRSD